MGTRPTFPARVNNAGPFAEQRGALVRYTTHLLEGDAVRAESVVQAAADELSAASFESAAQAAEERFAACRRRAVAMVRQEERAKRFTEPPAGSVQAGTEDHVALLRHIERLTPKQQEVVRLKFQNGFGHAAIAFIIELSDDKVDLLTHAAVARLRAEYPSQIPVDDHRVTACALDELDRAERDAFEAVLRKDPALRARVAEVRLFATQIEEALAIEAGVRTPRRIAAAGTRKKFNLLRFPALWWVLGGAAIAGAVAIFFLRTPKNAVNRLSLAGDFRLKPASWQEPADEKTEDALQNSRSADRNTTDPREKSFRENAAPSFPRTKSITTSTAPHAGETTGEAVEKKEYAAAAPQVAGAMGGAPAPRGIVDTGAGESSATKNAPVEKFRDAPTPAERESPASLRRENDSPASDSRPANPPPARPANDRGRTTSGGDYQTARENATSALPVDTDSASVPALFKAVGAGDPPAAAAVRVEELLNYFPTSDAAPKTADAFSATLECAEAPWAPTHRLVRIALKGRNVPPAPRAGANLVFLLDVSASMDMPNRLPLVQEAMRLLLGRLQPDDRVAVVTYAGESQVALPSTPVSSAARIRHALDALKPAGKTNGGAGIQLAYTIAKAGFVEGGVNRVILCTDGDFNLGLTSADDLSVLAAEQARERIFLSVFGFGRGRQIDARLESLAAQGQGRSGYVNTRREAERALAEEIDGLFAPIARDVRLEVAFNPAAVAGYRLIGYEKDGLPSLDAVPRSTAATVIGSGHSLTALYEIVPASPALSPANDDIPWLTFKIDYQEPAGTTRHQLEFPLEKTAGSFDHASSEFKFAAAVAGFGMILRDSPHRGSTTLAQVAEWAEAGLGQDPGDYRREFIDLVRGVQRSARPFETSTVEARAAR